MELFYASTDNINNNEIVLDDFEARHASQVLRKTVGDSITVTDGAGHVYRTTVSSQNPFRLKIEDKRHQPQQEPFIALAVGFIRPNRLEFILEKGTELGVNHFYLLRTEYANYASRNLSRFHKVLRQAIKQSQRYYLPHLQIFSSLEDFLNSAPPFEIRIAAIDAGFPSLGNSMDRKGRSYLLMIGPEGGLSKKEVALLKDSDFTLVSLNSHRLRAETAAISGIAIIQQYIHP